jgi:hypothetical protein
MVAPPKRLIRLLSASHDETTNLKRERVRIARLQDILVAYCAKLLHVGRYRVCSEEYRGNVSGFRVCANEAA